MVLLGSINVNGLRNIKNAKIYSPGSKIKSMTAFYYKKNTLRGGRRSTVIVDGIGWSQ